MEQGQIETDCDFQALFYPTKTLMMHVDPYRVENVRGTLENARLHLPPQGLATDADLYGIEYFPTIFPLIAPFVWIGWEIGWRVWTVILIAALAGSTLIIWQQTRRWSPGVALLLTSLVLVNCELSIGSANPAGTAIALCVIGLWCFEHARAAAAGVVCLTLSLLIKPHDGGLIWVFLLLSGGLWRRRAWQTLVLAVLASAAALMWVTAVAPEWPTELRVNLAQNSGPGHIDFPGALTAEELRAAKTVIDLQSVVAVFWRNPTVYNLTSYAVCGALLLVLAAATLRRRMTSDHLWVGLAAVVPLTLLIVYHRPYDARLLILAIPGCASLARRGGWTGRLSVLVTALAILFTGDLVTSLLLGTPEGFHLGTTTFGEKLAILLLTRAGVLALLAMSVFHTVAYVRARLSEEQGTLTAYDSRRAKAETAV